MHPLQPIPDRIEIFREAAKSRSLRRPETADVTASGWLCWLSPEYAQCAWVWAVPDYVMPRWLAVLIERIDYGAPQWRRHVIAHRLAAVAPDWHHLSTDGWVQVYAAVLAACGADSAMYHAESAVRHASRWAPPTILEHVDEHVRRRGSDAYTGSAEATLRRWLPAYEAGEPNAAAGANINRIARVAERVAQAEAIDEIATVLFDALDREIARSATPNHQERDDV